MKSYLLAINHAYLFFGTTLYVGVLWAMRFFWYPSWDQITLADVPVHFVGPTSRATSFFTIVVPLMFLTNIVFIISERKSPTVILAILCGICIGAATYVGQRYIIPVNHEIGAGLATQAELHAKLGDWMDYNTIRFWLLTPMWLFMMIYFVVKGHLLDVFAGRQL
jgi:hypothetical protein